MGNTVEVTAQVGIHHGAIALLQILGHGMHRVQGTAAFAIGVLLVLQVRFEDRFHDQQHGGLHHPVFDRGNPQRPLLAIRLGNIDPPDRTRLITLRSQLLRQFAQPLLHAVLLDFRERLFVHARCSVVRTALLPGGLQHVLPIHLVVQRVEAKAGRTLGFRMERRAESLQRSRVVRLLANHRLPFSCDRSLWN